MIQNPVLRGFHADPCMINANGKFYIANSTFEYYPGVKISESVDLANWTTVGYPLKNETHIDMKGNTKSCGVWAPCLKYHDGVFYLIYTDVKFWADMPFKDVPNYITTTTDIYGKWSKPVYINSSGFDPSLYIEDGKFYFVNMEWDYRKSGNDKFSGILITELDPKTLKPITKPVKVFTGTDREMVEGPHIFKRGEYYYLTSAEGGTSYEHALTVARSKDIYGPYEVHPQKHIISCWGDMTAYLQKAGHGNICESPDGRWWVAFLCGRPLNQHMNCPLGRETGINEVVWKNDWPYLKDGGLIPTPTFEGYGNKKVVSHFEYDFKDKSFMNDFQSLRVPCKHEVLEDGTLRMYGGESLQSNHEQNMLVRRQDSFSFTATTSLDFNPDYFQQLAGLIYRYSEENQYYFRVSYNENTEKRTLGLIHFDKYDCTMTPENEEVIVPDNALIHLKLTINKGKGYFSYSFDGEDFVKFNALVDSEKICDEYETPMGFTGAFVGMTCQDMQYHQKFADFKSFTYTNTI